MDDFKFEPTDSQEENLNSFFAYAIEQNPQLGQILLDNKDLLLQFENELSSTQKLAIRTNISKQVIDILNADL